MTLMPDSDITKFINSYLKHPVTLNQLGHILSIFICDQTSPEKIRSGQTDIDGFDRVSSKRQTRRSDCANVPADSRLCRPWIEPTNSCLEGE